MIAAQVPGRPARIAVIEGARSEVIAASLLPTLFRAGDVLVVNDAATLPGSLAGLHRPSGRAIELRLAGRRSLDPRDAHSWDAVLFGEGDFRTPTEHRPAPPRVLPGDRLLFGSLAARIEQVLGHPRMVRITFEGERRDIWEGIARHGAPIQYAHVPAPLALWDTWTAIAGPPVALEPPSAGFVLDWSILEALRRAGVEVVSLTHAAGLSSTGDASLDARLPLPEPYAIGASTALSIRRAKLRGARVIALGTSVARALESAALESGRLRAGKGLATLRLGPEHRLAVLDVLVTGVHEPGTSHYELMRAFLDEPTLDRATAQMEAAGLRHHEFGDAVWVARSDRAGRAVGTPPLRARRAK